MNKRNTSIIFFLFLSLIVFIAPMEVTAENEDTAHLSFEKTATLKKDNSAYIVKKGDWLANIIRIELVTDSYTDINKVIQKIKQLNPKIKNLNMIRPGQVLHMPSSYFPAMTPTGNTLNAENAEVQTEQQGTDKTEIFVRDAKKLAILKHIISNMKGTLITNGLYHIPLPQNGQVTIDCDKMPVVEFDDGSTALIDFSNSMPDVLRKLIQTSWKDYHIINYSSQDDIVSMLQKIIKSSKSYDMIKMAKLFNITQKPQVQIYSDWVISKKTSYGDQRYIQALSFLKDDSQLLPWRIVNYAQRNGLIITEIVDKHGVLKSQPLNEIKSDITNLNAPTNKDLISALLVTLDYTTAKDADVKLYNQIKDSGYNLTIKVDFLVKKNDKQYVIHSQALSKQILDILKEGGSEIILFDHAEKPNLLIEKLLRTMNVPFSFNTFSFTMPEKGVARAAINISAFRITDDQNEPVFLIDFDMDNEIYSLIQSIWRLKIVKY